MGRKAWLMLLLFLTYYLLLTIYWRVQGPLRAETARAILRSAEPDAHGRVGFAAFCSAMLPADVDTSIAVKVADYVAQSFV